MRKLLAFSLCIMLLVVFSGCATLSEDPVKRAEQIELYKQDAMDTIGLIYDLTLPEESLEDFKVRKPKQYATARFAFDRVISRLLIADEFDIVFWLEDLWDKLFEEETD